MSFVDRTPPVTFSDRIWQMIYRLGFPVARAWWRITRPRHVGALVAVYVRDTLLVVRSSYRSEWNLPGGGVVGSETPSQAARREVREEIGLSIPIADSATVVTGLWDERRDEVHIFKVTLSEPPTLRFDNREILGAFLAVPAELEGMALTGPLKAYLHHSRGAV